MDLSFQASPLDYLNCILQETKYQEETCEAIVPDSLPDILTIIDAYAEPYIRGKECRDGNVLLTGGIKGGILYAPEDQSCAKSLDFYMPFTTKFEQLALTEQAHLICSVKVRSVDGYAVNSRKALLRVNLGCQISAYEDHTETLYAVQDPPDCLQTKQVSYELEFPLETAEKVFVLNDSLELPPDFPPIDQIFKVHNEVFVQEQKLIGNKAIFKGTTECKVLYLGEDHAYHLFKKGIPFSQYCELRQEYDQESLELAPVQTGCNWEIGDENEIRHISLSVHILMQCLVSGTRTFLMTEDAYCIHQMLQPQWTAYDFYCCLDRQTYHQQMQENLPVSCKEVLDADIYVGFPSASISNDAVSITTPVQIHALGYTEDHTLVGAAVMGEDDKSISGSDHCKAVCSASCAGEPLYHLFQDRVVFTCELTLQLAFHACQTLTGLSGAAIEPCSDREEATPSLILRRAEPGTSLWQLAKQFQTRCTAIQAVNQLDEDVLHQSKIILIPIV